MGQRKLLSCRIDPIVMRLIKREAHNEGVKTGRIIEMMAGRLWGCILPDGWKPGRFVGDDSEDAKK